MVPSVRVFMALRCERVIDRSSEGGWVGGGGWGPGEKGGEGGVSETKAGADFFLAGLSLTLE